MNDLIRIIDWERAFHLARLLRHVAIPNDLNECWIWKAGYAGGQPCFRYKSGYTHPHRVVRHLLLGEELPERREHGGSRTLVMRHLCDNKKCVNPMHLKLGTQGQNMKDKFAPSVDQCIELLVSLGYTVNLGES
jgi:hypothetical protein